jgi:hypothetical protein
MAKMVGLSRGLKQEWLDKTAQLVLEGKSEVEIKNELNDYLSYEITSPTNIRKTRELLMNVWVYPYETNDEIRKDALSVYASCKNNRMPLHWCLILLKYPVFVDICGLIGKLTVIQDTFSTAWIKDKLFEEWGERATILHSSDKILQTIKYLGAIENQSVGTYLIKQRPVLDEGIIRVIVKTVLALKQKVYYELTDLSASPQMFPFVYDVTHEFIYNSGCFELSNFGGKAVLTSQ